MKLVLSFAALLSLGAANVAVAATDYTRVCNSSKLLASDRHECRVQMTAALEDQAKQAEINRVYTAKIASLLDKRAGANPAVAATSAVVPSAQ
ncbi:MAG: hypothetical protein AB7H70_02325 [Rhodospirillaceae bacterium]